MERQFTAELNEWVEQTLVTGDWAEPAPQQAIGAFSQPNDQTNGQVMDEKAAILQNQLEMPLSGIGAVGEQRVRMLYGSNMGCM